jgi:hypothetical protein
LPVFLFLTFNCGPAVFPVSVLVPSTELVWPRLKTEPTPEPARAGVVVRRAVASAAASAYRIDFQGEDIARSFRGCTSTRTCRS